MTDYITRNLLLGRKVYRATYEVVALFHIWEQGEMIPCARLVEISRVELYDAEAKDEPQAQTFAE